ncbi:MAG: hypothetical protein OQK50_01520 [Deltaproteobacteria bacterium]|jgi:hypothetical protein|nr:hypothetical protein [Deltaproteobacteria bacterium]MCW8891934.1 hypothetical protein [Deltaproteobacteria bacterium]MCW9048993.1 hypothetical protein [Deltaproteobacteria bacterium]
MFHNLIARAIVPVTIAVTGFVIFVCILLYSFVKSDMTAEAMRNLDNDARTVVKSARHAMMEDDRRAIQHIVTNIGTRSDVGLLKIYDHQGNVRYTGREEPEVLAATIDSHISGFLKADPSSTVTSQHDVDHRNGYISVSLPILNELKCSTAACHFHGEDEPYLGFLSIGVSSQNLEKTLALLRYRMIIFSVMVLFLTVGGVTALLRMNLFMPILRLTYNAEQAAQGVPESELPKSDHKLGQLNKDFRLLVKQRDQAWQDLKAGENRDSEINDGTENS